MYDINLQNGFRLSSDAGYEQGGFKNECVLYNKVHMSLQHETEMKILKAKETNIIQSICIK